MWVLALVECAPGCVADEFREKLFVHISPKCVQLRISESSLEIFVSNRDSFETRREGIFSPCEIERFLVPLLVSKMLLMAVSIFPTVLILEFMLVPTKAFICIAERKTIGTLGTLKSTRTH